MAGALHRLPLCMLRVACRPAGLGATAACTGATCSAACSCRRGACCAGWWETGWTLTCSLTSSGAARWVGGWVGVPLATTGPCLPVL